MNADRCRREIAAIEAWIAAHPGHPQQLGALMGWLDWQAELRLIEKQHMMDSGSTEPE